MSLIRTLKSTEQNHAFAVVGFAERKTRESSRRRTKPSLEDVMISTVDKPGEGTSADRLAGQSPGEREKFDQGPASAALSDTFIAENQSPST